MAATRFNQPELRRPTSSPRPKGRENAKDTLCRNVLIYGHCRYEDQGCAFNHDPNKGLGGVIDQPKKTLNVDSPSFTPAAIPTTNKASSITSQAVNAAPFTPRKLASGTATPTPQLDPGIPQFNPTSREFTQTYDPSHNIPTNGTNELPYGTFTMPGVSQAISNTFPNPYSDDLSNLTSGGSDATLPSIPGSYHSLVALDTTPIRSAAVFGYPSWVYKAVSVKNGKHYCLRRLEGFHLTNEKAIRAVKEWNKINLFDILQYDQQRPIKELQDEDLNLFGILMLSLATVNASITPHTNAQVIQTHVDTVVRNYSAELADTIRWLLTPPSPTETKDLQTFMRGISGRMASVFDSSLQANDELTSDLCRELENARLVRLMTKLGNINERYEFDNDPMWSENGDRYILKLFRDYVFHQVDAEGRPVTDMAWVFEMFE
ncbi:hypothetical protein DID88_003576 [Monilinia fructigena]|uniref:C3H1-type domain-containing protein n=1 Tax=Monilinia fructigena TaxID=38457 RepID=A0A395ITE0_9HELO|nr:hypothetical protein DID88_003576 [Monilinia fructigena]